jgi:hypothetical protein
MNVRGSYVSELNQCCPFGWFEGDRLVLRRGTDGHPMRSEGYIGPIRLLSSIHASRPRLVDPNATNYGVTYQVEASGQLTSISDSSVPERWMQVITPADVVCHRLARGEALRREEIPTGLELPNTVMALRDYCSEAGYTQTVVGRMDAPYIFEIRRLLGVRDARMSEPLRIVKRMADVLLSRGVTLGWDFLTLQLMLLADQGRLFQYGTQLVVAGVDYSRVVGIGSNDEGRCWPLWGEAKPNSAYPLGAPTAAWPGAPVLPECYEVQTFGTAAGDSRRPATPVTRLQALREELLAYFNIHSPARAA